MNYRSETVTTTPRSVRMEAVPLPDQCVRAFLNERRLVRGLAFSAAFLIVLGFLGQLSLLFLPDFFGRDLLAGLTDLNGESNLPETFSALLLFGAAIILAVIARAKRAVRDPYTLSWTGLTLIFCFLAIDESALFHERIMYPLHRILKGDGFLHYAWVIPYGIFSVVVLLACLRFLRHLPASLRNLILLGGAMYVMGALGFELFEGKVATVLGRHNLAMQLLITVEEALEMFGVIVFITALLRYVRLYLPGLTLQFGLTSAAPEQP